MMLSLAQLGSRDFSLSGIRVIRQVSPFRQLRIRDRKLNSFVYLAQGRCRFTYENGEFSMESGAVAYLPYGSCHVFDILSEDAIFYRVDFHLEVAGEVALFSQEPLLVSNRTTKACADAISRLATDYEFVQNSIAKTELMCRVFRELSVSTQTGEEKRLAPAVAYLSANLSPQITCKHLAKLCHLSVARFYDLFRQAYAVTPLAFRDRLLLQRARLLLEEGLLTVTEIADSLGFESVAYFSRFFKKHMGVSPSQYAQG